MQRVAPTTSTALGAFPRHVLHAGPSSTGSPRLLPMGPLLHARRFRGRATFTTVARQSTESTTQTVERTSVEDKALSSSTRPVVEDSTTAQRQSGDSATEEASGFSYVQFAQKYPFANNIMIATAKTAAADLIAQTVIAQTPLGELDLQRSLLFCLFGATYLGGFQYLYQVQIFKRLFNVDKFTTQSWGEKLRDGPGLQALAAQTALDLTVLTVIYLPTFYIFKAGVFSGSLDPSVWVGNGLESYGANFVKDEFDLIRVWLPADIVCFSVPLYLRLPVRHIVSFVWTAYLSFSRGGH